MALSKTGILTYQSMVAISLVEFNPTHQSIENRF